MFSPRERDLLRLIAEAPGTEVESLLRLGFPNPVYRRKLLWGIRKKVSASAEDWALYARASRRETRLVYPKPCEGVEPVPVYSEPFALLVQRLGHPLRNIRGAHKGTDRGGGL